MNTTPQNELAALQSSNRSEQMVSPKTMLKSIESALERHGFKPDPVLAESLRPQPVVKYVIEKITVAGVTDPPEDHEHLDAEAQQRRRTKIATIVVDVEESKCLELPPEQLRAITRYLYHLPFTPRQIRAAGEIIKATSSYRSIATDVWAQAFAESKLTVREALRLRADAYESGRLDERSSNREAASPVTGITFAITQLTEAKAQNERLRNRIKYLEYLLSRTYKQ